MIAGFIIKNGAKRVLIRAIGPSLTPLGVPGALNDPVVELHSSTALIASNDNWQTGNDVAAIQATGLAPNDTRESALLVSLEEGGSNVELVRAKSSLKLAVYADGEKIGQLEIGRGSLYWWGQKRKLNKRLSWSKFAEMMDRLAYG